MTSTVAAQQAAASPQADDKIALRVNGEPLFERDVASAVYRVLPRGIHGNISEEKKSEFRQKAIDELITGELFYREATRRGISAPEGEIAEAVKKYRNRYKSDRAFEKALKAEGYDLEGFTKRIEKSLTLKHFITSEINDKASVSDDLLKEHYEKHKAEFMRPEAVRLKVMTIKIDPSAASMKDERERARKEASELLEKARAGADFSDLAYKFSQDDWRVKGGDAGLVHKGLIIPELEEVAFRLNEGQISELVETIFGYHIIKVEQKIPPTQLGFGDVKNKLKQEIEDKRRKEFSENLIRELKAKAKIEIY